MTADRIPLIRPDWPAPANVAAVSTTRLGGVGVAPYDTFNLGARVGDDPDTVAANRRRLESEIGLKQPVRWLQQVHGNRVADLDVTTGEPEADAALAREPGVACAILTADCIPVLICDRAGTTVAAAHAGWRGLAGGVLEAAVAACRVSPDELLAWLGPGIGPAAFEVGGEVRSVFVDQDRDNETAFVRGRDDRWLADLYALAKRRLGSIGVAHVYGGDRCTFSEPDRFFSYRRDGRCGRMASLVWIMEK